jgi:hypothetical protein
MTATALWVRAWLSGSAGSDDLLESLARVAPDGPQVVSLQGSAPQTMPDLLRELRALPAPRVWLLIPRPGHPGAWPRELDDTPQPAVLVSADAAEGAGLLRPGAAGWRWDSCSEVPILWLEAQMLTARAGARALAEVVTAAAVRLETLGLERPATQATPRVWQRALGQLPMVSDPALHALMVRLAELHDALDLALREAGAAVTAGETRARSGEIAGVVGEVEDIICGVIGGMNASGRLKT